MGVVHGGSQGCSLWRNLGDSWSGSLRGSPGDSRLIAQGSSFGDVILGVSPASGFGGSPASSLGGSLKG